MGRRVVRVPLDFAAPLGEVWSGYLMPEELRLPMCGACDGNGSTTASRWVLACAHMLLMLDDDLREQARGRPMHPYFEEFDTSAYGTRPSPDIREFGTGLAGREAGFLGHDARDGWAAYRKIVQAAGLPETWGRCATCGGRGEVATDEQRAAHEAWKETEPPAGDGWQLWETVSEGSPISPVFATAGGLAAWMSDPARGRQWVPPDVAANFVAEGWAPSLVGSPEIGVVSGVEWVGTRAGGDDAA